MKKQTQKALDILLKGDDSVKIPKKEFVKEHKKLIKILEDDDEDEDNKEANEQKKELKQVMEKSFEQQISERNERTKNSLQKAFGSDAVNPNLFQKGAKVPVGTIRKRGNQNWIKIAETGNKQWKYHSLVGEGGVGTADLSSLTTAVVGAESFDAKMALVTGAGILDPEKIVDMTSGNLSEVLTWMGEHGMSPKQQTTADLKSHENLMPEIPAKERWDSYQVFIDMVASGEGAKSMIAYGTGGVGKTFLMKKGLARHKMTEYTGDEMKGGPAYDYVKITGKSTPVAMYKSLYEHNNKVIVFDDCDSVLLDDTSINLFKGALDSTGDGTISYGSGKPIKGSDGENLPQRFAFKGRVIFISNLTPEQMPQPLRSRALTIDLTMTVDETIGRLKEIVQHMPFQNTEGEDVFVSPEDRESAMEFFVKYKDKISVDDLNARTLGQVALIKKKITQRNANNPLSNMSWETVAIAMLG